MDSKIQLFMTNIKSKIDPKNTQIKKQRKEDLEAFLANEFKSISDDYESMKSATKQFETQINQLSREIEQFGDTLRLQPISTLCELIVKEADLWKAINDSKKEILVFDNKFEQLRIAVGVVDVNNQIKTYRTEMTDQRNELTHLKANIEALKADCLPYTDYASDEDERENIVGAKSSLESLAK